MNATAGNNGLQRPPLGKVLLVEGSLLLLAVTVAWCLDTATAWSILLSGG
jgi:hypothetical protein